MVNLEISIKGKSKQSGSAPGEPGVGETLCTAIRADEVLTFSLGKHEHRFLLEGLMINTSNCPHQDREDVRKQTRHRPIRLQHSWPVAASAEVHWNPGAEELQQRAKSISVQTFISAPQFSVSVFPAESRC